VERSLGFFERTDRKCKCISLTILVFATASDQKEAKSQKEVLRKFQRVSLSAYTIIVFRTALGIGSLDLLLLCTELQFCTSIHDSFDAFSLKHVQDHQTCSVAN
jgi:hypothetical protein